MNTHEMAAAETQPIGALGQTHIAFCMMKERTKELFNDKTKGPMDEVMNLATTTSRFDGLAAHLLRAVVLQYAGEFDDIERAEALDRYVDVNKVRLPDWQGALLSHMAADAALQLDDHASPLRIAVPQNLPDGAVGDTLVYRILGMKWGVANVDEWVATAKARGIAPSATWRMQNAPQVFRSGRPQHVAQCIPISPHNRRKTPRRDCRDLPPVTMLNVWRWRIRAAPRNAASIQLSPTI